MPEYIVAITGASGVVYGIRLAQRLLDMKYQVHLVLSEPACLVLAQEMNWNLSKPLEENIKQHLTGDGLTLYDNTNIAAPIASGSFLTEGMVIIPCSMSTLASVAAGMSNNLIERVADVMIKERRPLTLVPRETPLSSIHLRNLLSLSDLGVSIVPAMPAFYHRPRTLDDMISFIVGKVMDIMKVPNCEFERYKG